MLCLASKDNHAEIVAQLLEYGMDPQLATKTYGYTALHWAVENNCVAVVEMLIKAGANVDVTADRGCTPLVLANECNNQSCVDIFHKIFAKNAKRLFGMIPAACMNQNGKVLSFVVVGENGVSVDPRTIQQIAPNKWYPPPKQDVH